MLKKIISGHQSGADIAAIDAAKAHSFPCWGWVPRGRKTESGPLPEQYDVEEMITGDYPQSSMQNVIYSDGTVIFTHGILTGGPENVRKYAIEQNKPWLHIDLGEYGVVDSIRQITIFIDENQIETLNVAGKSASKDARIYEPVYRVIDGFLRYHG